MESVTNRLGHQQEILQQAHLKNCDISSKKSSGSSSPHQMGREEIRLPTLDPSDFDLMRRRNATLDSLFCLLVLEKQNKQLGKRR
jgi:hypothetical protein